MVMVKTVEKNGWRYEYDIALEYRKIYDYEVTDVRYVLGETFNPSIKKALICIGINPSTAIPENLDPTLARVQGYAKASEEYGAWYMLNVYPQRATDPDDLEVEAQQELCRHNLDAIKKLFTMVKNADVWCAWGGNITKRDYLKGCLREIINQVPNNYTFIKRVPEANKEYPHPLHPIASVKTKPQLGKIEKTELLTYLETF
ncbi:hypothetical protein FACS189452_09910 [Bacteroidia bacterium]|nr:hypothetical protein FACS189452_09910 [Bacteroidia bacterium]